MLLKMKKWFRKYCLWLALLSLPVLAGIVFLLNSVKGPEPIEYTEIKPYNVITGPPGQQLKKPTALAVGPRGEVYIADSGNHRITVIEEDGRYTLSFGGPGSGIAELQDPVSIDVAPNGHVYVADKSRREVIVYNSGGGYLFTISGDQRKDFLPLSVNVDSKSNAYIFDAGSRKFEIYNSGGKKTGDYTAKQLKSFTGILAADIDFDNKTIYGVASELPGFLRFSGNSAKTLRHGALVNPRGIAYNRSRKIVYISDRSNDKVFLFSGIGDYLGEFGGSGDGFGEFSYPAGLAYDERGKLYVADRDNNRVVIYSY